MGILAYSIRVNRPAIYPCSPDWRWDCRPDMMRDFDLWYVQRGRGWLRAMGEERAVGPGACFLMRPGGEYHGRHDPRQPLTVMAAHFDFLNHYGREVCPAESELPLFYRRLRECSLFEQLFIRTVEAFRSGERHKADAWLQAALMEVEHQDGLPMMDAVTRERREAVDRLCSEIVRNSGAAYRLGTMAKAMHCSADHFARVFREFKGVPPGEFVLATRIEAAKNLLRGSSHSVTRIAELLGYRDVYYFSKQFRQRVGMTPTRFRKA